jgi:hypothetical protein
MPQEQLTGDFLGLDLCCQTPQACFIFIVGAPIMSCWQKSSARFLRYPQTCSTDLNDLFCTI